MLVDAQISKRAIKIRDVFVRMGYDAPMKKLVSGATQKDWAECESVTSALIAGQMP